MSRRSLLATTTALTLAIGIGFAALAGAAPSHSRIRVVPSSGLPSTEFKLRFAAPFGEPPGDEEASYEYSGTGPPGCAKFELSTSAPFAKRGEQVTVDLNPLAIGEAGRSTWCVGRYSGQVKWSQTSGRLITRERVVGRFRFTVEAPPKFPELHVYTLSPQAFDSLTEARNGDVYLARSANGSTEEIVRLLPNGRTKQVAGSNPNFDDPNSGDGGPAKRAVLGDAVSPAVGPDRTLYFIDGGRVRAIRPDGAIVAFAGGAQSSAAFAGDGGPAREASLSNPSAIAVTRRGTLLIADTDNRRIREVQRDGTIHTVAGTGVQGSSGVGGPATHAQLNSPEDVAAAPDGSFYVSDRGARRIYKVTPRGKITVFSRGDFLAIATTAHGVLLADTGDGIAQFDARGRWDRVAGGTDDESPLAGDDYDGARATTAVISENDFTAAADGGILMLDDNGLRYLAPPRAGRAAVAWLPTHGVTNGISYGGRYRATLPGSATVELYRNGHRVARAAGRASAGDNTITLHKRLKPADYVARIVIRTRDGQTAVDWERVFLGGRLPTSVARDTLRPSSECGSNCSETVTDRGCHRFGPTRVDCSYSVDDACTVAAAILDRAGLIETQAYSCASARHPFKRHADFSGDGPRLLPDQTGADGLSEPTPPR